MLWHGERNGGYVQSRRQWLTYCCRGAVFDDGALTSPCCLYVAVTPLSQFSDSLLLSLLFSLFVSVDSATLYFSVLLYGPYSSACILSLTARISPLSHPLSLSLVAHSFGWTGFSGMGEGGHEHHN